jgi:serine phosphatase RsbU (regulator of sigma subunit)
MNLVSVPVAVMAGICLYVGMYYLLLFYWRRKEKENLAFSLLCISIGLYDIFCVGLYNAPSPAEGMFWQRLQFASLDLFSMSLGWFAYHITGRKSKRIYLALEIVFATLFVLVLFVHNGLTFSLAHPLSRRIQLWGLIDITYNEVLPGPLCVVQAVIMMGGFAWIIYSLIRNYRRRKRILGPVLAAFTIFFIGAANDVLVGADAYRFIYVIEYVYLFIISTMSILLLGNYARLFRKVEVLNVGLEERVRDRTNELEAAMKELETTNCQLIKTKDALWGEMQLAKKIQTVLLPREPRIRGYDITGYICPAEEVGGDYYDIINATGADWIVIGDVSGHGVLSGLIMMMAQTSIHMALRFMPAISPAALVSAINSVIYENIRLMSEDKFMTITVIACHDDGKCHFSGIHQDIMIFRADVGAVELQETQGMFLGVLPDIRSRTYENYFTLNRGDVMLLYTDGITEAFDGEGREFSQQRLEGILRESGRKSPEEIKEAVLNALKGYDCKDDVTMVVIRRT